MPKMVCVQCQRELTPLENGVYLIEIAWFDARPMPYKIYQADLWKCAKCDTRIVAGLALNPAARRFDAGFGDLFVNILETPGNWVIFDYENEEQREAGVKMGYKNSYGQGLGLTPHQAEVLNILLKR